jgi:hypothetical protein
MNRGRWGVSGRRTAFGRAGAAAGRHDCAGKCWSSWQTAHDSDQALLLHSPNGRLVPRLPIRRMRSRKGTGRKAAGGTRGRSCGWSWPGIERPRLLRPVNPRRLLQQQTAWRPPPAGSDRLCSSGCHLACKLQPCEWRQRADPTRHVLPEKAPHHQLQTSSGGRRNCRWLQAPASKISPVTQKVTGLSHARTRAPATAMESPWNQARSEGFVARMDHHPLGSAASTAPRRPAPDPPAPRADPASRANRPAPD